jgi:hypothetical protein
MVLRARYVSEVAGGRGPRVVTAINAAAKDTAGSAPHIMGWDDCYRADCPVQASYCKNCNLFG